MAGDLYNDLLVELECAICTNYMAPPIRQCATGHSICDNCCKKLPACPLCQAKFNEARNIALEALAKKINYPCIYQKSGCTARLPLDDREQHEAQCTYRGYKCQLPKCTWAGRAEDIAAHWEGKKISSKPYQDKNICHVKIKTDSYYVNLVQAHNQMFWYKFKSSLGKLQWCMQYIGAPEDSEDYNFEIEIFKQAQPKSRILLSDYCQDAFLEQSEVFKTGNCISIPVDMVLPFVGDDQVLIYYMRVFKIEDNGKDDADKKQKRRYNKNVHKNTKKDNSRQGGGDSKKPDGGNAKGGKSRSKGGEKA